MRLLRVLGEVKLLFGGKLLSAKKFVHEMGVPCAELFLVAKFVHERGVLCAELLSAMKFVHEMGVPCAELLHRSNNQHLLPIMQSHCKDVV